MAARARFDARMQTLSITSSDISKGTRSWRLGRKERGDLS
jgi:hypothetical protein